MKKEEILAKVASGEIKPEDAARMLETEVTKGGLRLKVSEKGAVSVYNLQRMPVTLYGEQWTRLLDFGDDIRQFIKDHDHELKKKEK